MKHPVRSRRFTEEARIEGLRLRALRESIGIAQWQLGRIVGEEQTVISRVERGERAWPKVIASFRATLPAVANAVWGRRRA